MSQVTSSNNSEYKDVVGSQVGHPLVQAPMLNELSDNYYHSGLQPQSLGHDKPPENLLAPAKTS